jgi:hypothetical protein
MSVGYGWVPIGEDPKARGLRGLFAHVGEDGSITSYLKAPS